MSLLSGQKKQFQKGILCRFMTRIYQKIKSFYKLLIKEIVVADLSI